MKSLRPECYFLVLLLTSCASVVDGTLESAQSITLTSTPTGASVYIGHSKLCDTPCRPRVENWRIKALEVRKPGYVPAQISAASEVDATTFGNILAGGLLGVAIDVASGRVVKYQDSIHVRLEHEQPRGL